MISRRKAMGRTEPTLTNLNYNGPRPWRRPLPEDYGITSHFHGPVREPGHALPPRARPGRGTEPDVILQLPGGPAHSEFRLAKMLPSLRAAAPQVRDVSSRFLHLADCAHAPDPKAQQRFAALLT